MGKDSAFINNYQMRENVEGYLVKSFDEDLMERLDFVCKCRAGGKDYQKYDLIFGRVADDKVFRVVDMYHSGIWNKERTLKEIKVYPAYAQIAFISQKAIENLLVWESIQEV